MKLIYLVLLLGAIWWSSANAASFVGNGGQTGDVELQVSINQMRETLLNIQREKDLPEVKLCTCYEMYEGHPLCSILKDLNEEQVKFCAQMIKDHTDELIDLLSRKDDIKITWTTDTIEVRENGRRKTVDAVANYQNSELTIQQDHFLSQKPYERVFLLAHEYGHFLKHEDKPLIDEGKIGPFQGNEGGRKLLNAMAASLAIEAKDYKVMDKYSNVLNRSRATKNIWLSASYNSYSTSADTQSVYFSDRWHGGSVEARYQWDSLGLFVRGRFADADEKIILDTIHSKEYLSAYGGGVTYRLFIKRDPTTFWGQSHLLFDVGVEFGQNRMEIKENNFPQNDLNDKVNSTIYSAGLRYYIPFEYGLWGFIGAGYFMNHYKYKEVNIENKKDQTMLSLGVSYAF